MTQTEIFTVGHSNHSGGYFLSLLKKHNIAFVVDVRSAPYSRFNPQFNKDDLKASLKSNGITYAFFGKDLGGEIG